MAAPLLFGTVVHLAATGHVLAAVTSGSLEPTVEDLTGGDHLRVRVPGDTDYVEVPTSVLKATRVTVTGDADVLDRPQWYVVSDGTPALTLGTEPQYGTAVTVAAGTAGKKVVVVWQTADKGVAESTVLDGSGNPPSQAPPGATVQLVAYEGGPLYVKSL